MLEVRSDRAPGMFPRCSRYISTVLDVGFDSARGVFLTVLDVSLDVVCFDRARGMFRPCLSVFGHCSRYVSPLLEYYSTVLELCFDRARVMFRPCSSYVPTVLEV